MLNISKKKAVTDSRLIATSVRDRSSDLSLYTDGVDIPDASGSADIKKNGRNGASF
jgi:hypothetical protein